MAPPETSSAPAPPAEPRRADARRNRQKLVDAARQVVADVGAGVSMEEVARRAGVGVATLYRNFPTRDVLVEAVFLDAVVEMTRRAEQLAADPDPMGALDALLRAHAALAAEGHCLGARVMAAKKTPGSPINLAAAELRAADVAALARAQAAGAVRPTVEVAELLRLVHGVVLIDAANPDPELLERSLQVILAGIRSGA